MRNIIGIIILSLLIWVIVSFGLSWALCWLLDVEFTWKIWLAIVIFVQMCGGGVQMKWERGQYAYN